MDSNLMNQLFLLPLKRGRTIIKWDEESFLPLITIFFDFSYLRAMPIYEPLP